MSIKEENWIDEEHEDWINLMYCHEAAKESPELRKLLEERVSPEVLKAADECSGYEDFKRLLALYRANEKG